MKKNKKLFLLLTLTPFLGYLSSCSQSDTIIFANYQSYMNPDVMDKASAITNNNISFVSFEGDDEVQRKFANYYDVAIPSSCQAIKLLSQHLLDKINYPMFGIAGIDNGNDLKNLLNASTKKAVDIIDTYVDGHLHWNLIEPGATNPTILDFAIPYFLQDWIFAYENNSAISDVDTQETWSGIINAIGKNNPQRDPMFIPSKQRKIAMVDDYQSIFDMSKIITDVNTGSTPSINPAGNQDINWFKNVLSSLTSNFDSGSFLLNPDSGEILNSLADPAINSSAIAYNGDILYAALGAGVESWENHWNSSNFHVVKPNETFVALDLVVFNKKLNENLDKKQKAYNAVKSIALDGLQTDAIISDTTEDDNYKYGIMQNLDYVLYYSPWEKTREYMDDEDSGYFKQYFDESEDITLMKKIYDVDVGIFQPGIDIIELPFSDINKSNLHWAYVEEKEKL